jgi:hypothetical protein
LRRFACVLLGLFGMAAAHAETAQLQPFVASYAVTYRGLEAGTLTFQLKRDGERYVYETRANPSFLARLVVSQQAVERSTFEITPAGVRPLQWQLEDGKSGTKKDGALDFDWNAQTVRGEIEGQKIELPAEPGLQDRLSIQVAVVAMLLRGQEPGAIPLIDDNRVKRYTYSKKEAASLDTKLGKLDTVVYESTREGSNRVSRFWLAPSLEYVPARAEQVRKGKVETVMTLLELKRE